MHYISEIQASADVPLYQLKITLKWSKPPIWRRVLVRADMKLDRLHGVIQIAMGWTNSHLHQFVTSSRSNCTFYGVPDPEFADMGAEKLNEKRYTLAHLAPAGKSKFVYEYDFGDGWEHLIVAEKILPANPDFKHPICLAGAKACPPEDCGGIHGYYKMLEIAADPKNLEHEEMKEWLGGEFDAEEFSVDEVNSFLKRLKA